jgi:hypothetical protein
MRKTFLSADGYKYFNINRKDVEQKTARYNQAHVAMKFTENLSTGVMFKHLAYNCAFANHQRLLYLMVLVFF